MIEILSKIGYIFSGFILGVYFEKYKEDRKDKSWLKNALKSIKYDLTRDHELFEKTIKVGLNSFKAGKNLLIGLNQMKMIFQQVKKKR